MSWVSAEIGFKERINISDIGPISVILVTDNFLFADGSGYDFLSEICRIPILFKQQVEQNFLAEDIDTHGGQINTPAFLHFRPGVTYPVFGSTSFFGFSIKEVMK